MTLSRRRFLKGTGAGVAVGAALRAEAKPAAGRCPPGCWARPACASPSWPWAAAAASSCTRKRTRRSRRSTAPSTSASPTWTPPSATATASARSGWARCMKDRRKGIFLATKINKRKGDEAMKILEGSLKRLQTDQIDLIHIHDLKGADDLAAIEAKDGVLAVLRKLRDQKVDPLHRRHQPHRSRGAQDRARAARLRLHPDGAQRRPGGDEVQPQGHGPQHRHDDQLRDRGPAGGPGQEDGHHRHEDLRAGGAGRRRPHARSCSTTRCRCRWPPPWSGMPKLEHLEEDVQLARAFKPLPQGRDAHAVQGAVGEVQAGPRHPDAPPPRPLRVAAPFDQPPREGAVSRQRHHQGRALCRTTRPSPR